jgi:hypothetical protein
MNFQVIRRQKKNFSCCNLDYRGNYVLFVSYVLQRVAKYFELGEGEVLSEIDPRFFK